MCIKDTKEYGDEWDSSMVTTTKCGCKMGMIGPVHALISECGVSNKHKNRISKWDYFCSEN